MLEMHQILIAGRYRLLRRLRRGGMSEVFLAFDEQAQQQVALKLVGNDSSDCFKRLKREVQVLRRLSHKHILPVLDYGEWDRYAFLVMPYIKHGNLRDLLAKGPLTQEEAGNILSQVADALQCAHEHDILHRDIKSSNILLDNIEDDAIYLADFGLAKSPGEGSDITQTGCLIGTPEYMAPELAIAPESPSSDIYALGIVLYHMLTGQLPFSGTTPLAICWKHVQELPPPPSTLIPTIAPAIEAIILRAIDKDPACRFASARSMAQEYEQALHLSRQSPSHISQLLPPAQALISRLAQRPTMPVAHRRIAKSEKHRPGTFSTRRKSLLGLVALVWLTTSVGLGFIAGRAGIQAGAVASIGAHSIVSAVQPISPTRLEPPVQPTSPAQPLSPAPTLASKIVSKRLPSPPAPGRPHKHHGHRHGNGGGNGDGGGGD